MRTHAETFTEQRGTSRDMRNQDHRYRPVQTP